MKDRVGKTEDSCGTLRVRKKGRKDVYQEQLLFGKDEMNRIGIALKHCWV